MNVCSECFNDIEIKNFIDTNSSNEGKCNFCEAKHSKYVSLSEMLDFFASFLEVFQHGDDEGLPLVDLISKDWQIFSNKTDSKKILSEILEELNLSFTPESEVVYLTEITECVSYWETLKNDLRWERRFLTDIEEIFEYGWDSFFVADRSLSKEDLFYRARIHTSNTFDAYPKKEMSCPPKDKVLNGRANPEGIPYLYLSETLETTLYETRVTYYDDVSIGVFKVKKGQEVKLVDFTNYVSPFLYVKNMIEHAKSRLLQKEIDLALSKPMRRYDSLLEYVPTQFICEFIRYVTGADGIVFNSSVHDGGVNLVIFNHEKFECIKVDKHQITSVKIQSKPWEELLPDFG